MKPLNKRKLLPSNVIPGLFLETEHDELDDTQIAFLSFFIGSFLRRGQNTTFETEISWSEIVETFHRMAGDEEIFPVPPFYVDELVKNGWLSQRNDESGKDEAYFTATDKLIDYLSQFTETESLAA